MYTLESAQLKDIEICCNIINDGKEFQRKQGFVQWTDDYPSPNTIQTDIQDKKGYVIKAEDKIVGYMCIDFEGEPAYAHIKGEWRSNLPYAVIHRMAFSKDFIGVGLTDVAFKLIDELCIKHNIRNIRADTDFLNERMQHILKKNGFINCGEIIFQGSEKLAYDKLL